MENARLRSNPIAVGRKCLYSGHEKSPANKIRLYLSDSICQAYISFYVRVCYKLSLRQMFAGVQVLPHFRAQLFEHGAYSVVTAVV